MIDKKLRHVTTIFSTSISQEFLIVPLNRLHPHPFNLRTRRHPAYDTLKASIGKRGLEVPLSVTRRPGDAHYRLCGGGNTRLAILRELWAQTGDDRFFRVHCRFHCWPPRGELMLLTGYLANNSLRSDLTFVEQALGITKAHRLYEREAGTTVSPSELADRLAADGYPVALEQIHFMIDSVRHLLPAIPNRLHKGLERNWIEQLLIMRWASERVWARHAGDQTPVSDFGELFQQVLSSFDAAASAFAPQRVQDTLIGQMSERLGVDYDLLALELEEAAEVHRRMLDSGLAEPPQPARCQSAEDACATNAGASTGPIK